MGFAECMADGLPLRESAARCGVSPCTSWFMRMRVCEAMRRLLLPARAGTFHVDGTLVRDNLSENLKSSRLELVRGRHRNGQDGLRRARGSGKERIVVECDVNEYGTASATPSTGARRVRAPSPWTLPRGYPKGPRW